MHKPSLITLVPFALAAACGGSGSGAGVSDKQGAAGAAYHLQQEGDSLHNRSGQGLSPAQVGNLPGVTQSFTVSGSSGKATITNNVNVGTGDVSVEYTIKYEGYSKDGVLTYDGELTHRVHVSGNGVAGDVSTQMIGEVVITGETSGHLKMDVALHVSTDGSGGRVEYTGYIEGDGTRFDYNAEVIELGDLD